MLGQHEAAGVFSKAQFPSYRHAGEAQIIPDRTRCSVEARGIPGPRLRADREV